MTEEDALTVPPEPKYTLPSRGAGRSSALVKCSDCEQPTNHEVFEIRPVPLQEDPPIAEILKMVRRLMMCTNCGKISLKK